MANKNKNNNDPAAATTATLAHHLRQFLTDPTSATACSSIHRASLAHNRIGGHP